MEKERKHEKKRIGKVIRTLSFNKIKRRIFIGIVFISFLLEIWIYYAECLKIICEPAVLGVTYYVFWIFQLLNIYILMNIQFNQTIFLLLKLIIFFLQIVYWYTMTLVISFIINHIRGHRGRRKRKKEKHIAGFIKKGIEKDLREAEKLEKK